jgi:hypothetical protein
VRVAALHVFEIALYEVLVCCGMNDVVYGLLGVLCILKADIHASRRTLSSMAVSQLSVCVCLISRALRGISLLL